MEHDGKCITVFSAPNYCDQVRLRVVGVVSLSVVKEALFFLSPCWSAVLAWMLFCDKSPPLTESCFFVLLLLLLV